MQSEGHYLEGRPIIGMDDTEHPPLYFVHGVSWNSLSDWLESRHVLLDGNLEYEVRDSKRDRLVCFYREGERHEGPDPLQPVWDALKKEIDECASRVNVPFRFDD